MQERFFKAVPIDAGDVQMGGRFVEIEGPARDADVLVGLYFSSPIDEPRWEGRVMGRLSENYYLVTLPPGGAPDAPMRIVHITAMQGWHFYRNAEQVGADASRESK